MSILGMPFVSFFVVKGIRGLVPRLSHNLQTTDTMEQAPTVAAGDGLDKAELIDL